MDIHGDLLLFTEALRPKLKYGLFQLAQHRKKMPSAKPVLSFAEASNARHLVFLRSWPSLLSFWPSPSSFWPSPWDTRLPPTANPAKLLLTLATPTLAADTVHGQWLKFPKLRWASSIPAFKGHLESPIWLNW